MAAMIMLMCKVNCVTYPICIPICSIFDYFLLKLFGVLEKIYRAYMLKMVDVFVEIHEASSSNSNASSPQHDNVDVDDDNLVRYIEDVVRKTAIDACVSNFGETEKVVCLYREVVCLSNSEQIDDAFETFDDDGVFESFCENACHSDGFSGKGKYLLSSKWSSYLDDVGLYLFGGEEFVLAIASRVSY
ncbi:hypothetical protein Drorol1_Dr00023662 [Drosera rotundifolia]